jgi:hypothetical protein
MFKTKNILLVVITTLAAFTAKGQHVIELYKQPFNLANANFCIDSVLDARYFKGSIGTVQKGLNNRRVEAVLPDTSLARHLTTYFHQQLPRKDEKITLAVTELLVGEETRSFSEHGFVDLEVMFLRPAPNGGWWLLHETETRIEGSGMDVTGKHPDRIWLAFEAVLQEFAKLDPQKLPQGVLANLPAGGLPDATVLAKRETWVKGIYKNYQELLNNAPSVRDSAYQVTKNKRERVTIVVPGSGKHLRRMYAYSDGQDVYVSARQYSPGYPTIHYAKVRCWGRYLIIDDVVAPDMNTMAAAFGLIGAVVASANAGLAVIDTKTGKSFPLTKANLRNVILANHADLKDRFNKMTRQDDPVMEGFVRSVNKAEAGIPSE